MEKWEGYKNIEWITVEDRSEIKEMDETLIHGNKDEQIEERMKGNGKIKTLKEIRRDVKKRVQEVIKLDDEVGYVTLDVENEIDKSVSISDRKGNDSAQEQQEETKKLTTEEK